MLDWPAIRDGRPQGTAGEPMAQDNETFRSAKRQMWLAMIMLGVGVIYALFPIDFIPDILGPIGWVDDIGILTIGFLTALVSYYRVRKAQSH